MTKFLKQTCSFEQAKRTSRGEVQLDDYGEVQYRSPRRIKCRCERVVQDVQTSNGAILKSSTRYFTDEAIVIRADDRLDGKVVLEVRDYVNQLGKVEGCESYV